MKPKTNRSVGPNEKSRVSHKGAGGLGGSARMRTLFLRRGASRLSVAKGGRWVEKPLALVCPGPALTAVLAVPVIASPVAVMLTTLPALTWSTKTLYGMVTDGGWPA